MTTMDGYDLPEDAIELGHGTYYTKVYQGDQWVAIHEWHQENGVWGAGFIPFAGRMEASTPWEVVSEEPLTLNPSVACRTCSHHGFIRGGRWWPV